ncbi:permease [Schinkia azotoformans]|uniref:permease n=1 Tax=Schinkia azotoformans TaxID=1454 RepID=UPI002DB71BFA|nr:permease [Schinkia azotoformans]MEC1718938.1 permease [Schinkia azotoformans]MED4412032.1 permease [Schinkia azotoformans]
MFKWLADWLVEDIFGLSVATKFGGAVHFFIYDTTKIIALIAVMIFIISYIRSYFPPEKVKEWLQGRGKGVASVLAALLGVVSPFCSCSTVPLFIGFVEAGIPLGITFTFLISSPIVNEISLVMLFSIFGWKIAVIYVFFGVILSIVAGVIIGRLKLERYVESYVFEVKMGETAVTAELTVKDRLQIAKDNVIETVKKIWVYILIGIGIGAFIHGYAPEELLVKYAGEGNPFAVPVAVLLGVPLYSNAVGALPIVEALMQKGVASGTALAFMMAMTALSLPEMILLRKLMKPQLIGVFVGVVSIGIILIGYGFNIIL